MTPQTLSIQTTLPLEASLSDSDATSNYGEVFTREWVVNLILDLCGFTVDIDLCAHRLVDPACGNGAFLGPVTARIIESCRSHGRRLEEAESAVRAYDVQQSHVDSARDLVGCLFVDAGLSSERSRAIAETWIDHGDFIVTPHDEETADFVVGNPPYIRLEDITDDRLALYRQTCTTMTGRADIYLGFFELGLRLLKKGGLLGFICADRWMRNAYGKRLRGLVTSAFSMEVAIEMHDVDAFAKEVSAYPAITVMKRGPQTQALVVSTTHAFDARAAGELHSWSRSHHDPGDSAIIHGGTHVARLPGWFDTSDSWPTGSPERMALLRELEERLPPLETDTTRIGIGVATGADAVFVTTEQMVEPDRLIPLVMTRDITGGRVDWKGAYLVNPWARPRELVDLRQYPLLGQYLEQHAPALRRRHIAGKRPAQWYRTIDPVHVDLVPKAKLLFPDMKMTAHPVLDRGGYYPHHNLYYVTSTSWDLEVLGGLLLSRVAQFFIESYAVRMRGGTLRFQAQYLRRIRVPRLEAIDLVLADKLRDAFLTRDASAATRYALRAYGLRSLPD